MSFVITHVKEIFQSRFLSFLIDEIIYTHQRTITVVSLKIFNYLLILAISSPMEVFIGPTYITLK